MTSVLNVDEIAAKDGTSPVALTKQSAAKAWAGGITDSAVADDSFNVASITDNGSGENQPNWTNSFDSAGYASPASCQHDSGFYNRLVAQHTKATGSVKLKTYQADNATASSIDQQLTANGDLA